MLVVFVMFVLIEVFVLCLIAFVVYLVLFDVCWFYAFGICLITEVSAWDIGWFWV